MARNRQAEKGKALEREVVALAREHFPDAYRTGHAQGEGGAHARPDIEGIPGAWLSVKGGHRVRVVTALEEARAAAHAELRAKRTGTARVPVVAFRQDRDEWCAALPLGSLLVLMRLAGLR